MDGLRVTFDASLETGYPEIDAMHRELFNRIDQLLASSRERRSQEEVARTLAFLGDYVVHHFAAEERLMAQTGYPGLLAHKAEHARFVQEFSILYGEFRSEGPSSLFVIRIGNRVTTWLREHIYRTDRAMVEHLKVQR